MVATGFNWVEGKDAAPHPTMHGTFPTTKAYFAPNVSSAKVEKP